MRRSLIIHCAAAALAASFGATAWAANGGESSQRQANSSSSRENQSQAKEQEQNQAPEGYVLLEENTVYMMANEPQQHFLQAHADLARKDDRGAAEETRMAAAYLDMQAARRGDNQDQGLKQQADHLRHMARELESGKASVSVEHLDRDFARASDALARHFDNLTKYDLQKQRYIPAGYDLNATAHAFKNTIIWSDQKPSKDDLTMIKNAREIAADLRGNEVYQGEQALKTEQKDWNKEGNKEAAQAKPGEAQPANAKLPAGVSNSPLTGTTPAEARNDAQHAQKMADALGQAIDKSGSMIDQNKSGSAESNESRSQAQKESSANQKPSGNSQQTH